MTADEAISSLFTFIPPTKFIHDPRVMQDAAVETSFADLPGDDASTGAPVAPASGGPGEEAPIDSSVLPAPQEEQQIQPLRSVKFSSDAKHILATIIKSVYGHFLGPSCQQVAKRLDGIRRVILRNNSKAAKMEPLLMFALIQGNVASARRFPSVSSSPVAGEIDGELAQQIERFQAPSNASSAPGIYDPVLIASYFDLGKRAAKPT